MSKKNTIGGLVFSTNPDFKFEADEPEQQDLSFEKQVIRLWLERGKGGKESTVIKGFVGSDDSLADLAKTIKNKCAAGGSAKDGIIIVQGDHRDKVLKLLTDLGVKNVKKAGG
jgi:translation initiation factor 1